MLSWIRTTPKPGQQELCSPRCAVRTSFANLIQGFNTLSGHTALGSALGVLRQEDLAPQCPTDAPVLQPSWPAHPPRKWQWAVGLCMKGAWLLRATETLLLLRWFPCDQVDVTCLASSLPGASLLLRLLRTKMLHAFWSLVGAPRSDGPPGATSVYHPVDLREPVIRLHLQSKARAPAEVAQRWHSLTLGISRMLTLRYVTTCSRKVAAVVVAWSES